jgi:hypothetical protein
MAEVGDKGTFMNKASPGGSWPEQYHFTEVCQTCTSPDRDKPYTSHFAGVPIAECADEFHAKVCPTCESTNRHCRKSVGCKAHPGGCSYSEPCPDPWHKVDSLPVERISHALLKSHLKGEECVLCDEAGVEAKPASEENEDQKFEGRGVLTDSERGQSGTSSSGEGLITRPLRNLNGPQSIRLS